MWSDIDDCQTGSLDTPSFIGGAVTVQLEMRSATGLYGRYVAFDTTFLKMTLFVRPPYY